MYRSKLFDVNSPRLLKKSSLHRCSLFEVEFSKIAFVVKATPSAHSDYTNEIA